MKKTLIALMMMGLSTGAMASAECFAVGLFAEKVYEYKEQGNGLENAEEEFITESLYGNDTIRMVQMLVVGMIYDNRDTFRNKIQAGRTFLEYCNEGGFNE